MPSALRRAAPSTRAAAPQCRRCGMSAQSPLPAHPHHGGNGRRCASSEAIGPPLGRCVADWPARCRACHPRLRRRSSRARTARRNCRDTLAIAEYLCELVPGCAIWAGNVCAGDACGLRRAADEPGEALASRQRSTFRRQVHPSPKRGRSAGKRSPPLLSADPSPPPHSRDRIAVPAAAAHNPRRWSSAGSKSPPPQIAPAPETAPGSESASAAAAPPSR